MPIGDLFGLVAGAVSTSALIPQIIRVFKLKSAREISLIFTSLMVVGIVLWLAYGIYFRLFPLMLWNSVAAALTGTLLYAKLKYGR
jgi:MtN3 and saliva related transmembrane protein